MKPHKVQSSARGSNAIKIGANFITSSRTRLHPCDITTCSGGCFNQPYQVIIKSQLVHTCSKAIKVDWKSQTTSFKWTGTEKWTISSYTTIFSNGLRSQHRDWVSPVLKVVSCNKIVSGMDIDKLFVLKYGYFFRFGVLIRIGRNILRY